MKSTTVLTMSKTHMPARFNGEADNFYDPNFTLDINNRMRVPKSIRVNGDHTDQDVSSINGSTWNQTNSIEKLDMHVPDRILVAGQEQHIGTKAPPREIILENAVMPSEPGMIRVLTPPRILTLDDHYFPAVDEEDPVLLTSEEKESSKTCPQYNTEVQTVKRGREQTPSYNVLDVSLSHNDELQHLRRQVGKLNRRVMALELEMLQRQQRNKIIYALTLAYCILKTISWLNRN